MEKQATYFKERFSSVGRNDETFRKNKVSKVRKDVLSLEKRIAVSFHSLKDQGSMRMTANAFGIARCTVGQIVQETYYFKILVQN